VRPQIGSPRDAQGHARKGPAAALIALPYLRGLFGMRFGACLDGSFGAFSSIRRVVSHRLQSADSRHSRDGDQAVGVDPSAVHSCGLHANAVYRLSY
jgi:hypothetical protein